MHTTIRGILAAIALLSAATFAAPLGAQTAADSAGIRAAALDYIDGWYAGDAARMERALHPELAKRIVATDPATGQSRIGQMGASVLVNQTREGGGSDIPTASRRNEVRIFEIYNNTASVRVTATGWIDYMHLAKWNGQWKIVNVLWQVEPRQATRP